MKHAISTGASVTPMTGMAFASALVFAGAIAWSVMHSDAVVFSAAKQKGAPSAEADGAPASALATIANAATSSTPLGDAIVSQFVTRYMALSHTGAATDTLAATAADITPSIDHTTYTAADVKTDPDTSLKAVIRYRADMRIALAPLLKNTDPEIEIYARYVDTGDAAYLDRLASVAADYRTAIAQALAVAVPQDAVSYHVGVLNAMSAFAVALDGLARNAGDPVASLALLRTYNAAEKDMFTSFNSLGTYAAHKTL